MQQHIHISWLQSLQRFHACYRYSLVAISSSQLSPRPYDNVCYHQYGHPYNKLILWFTLIQSWKSQAIRKLLDICLWIYQRVWPTILVLSTFDKVLKTVIGGGVGGRGGGVGEGRGGEEYIIENKWVKLPNSLILLFWKSFVYLCTKGKWRNRNKKEALFFPCKIPVGHYN